MKTDRSGFTLMEIMVVIIVIAVLASVAGPMIGSITDQGRASATKAKISALKSAIMAYKSDLGRYPFLRKACNSKYAQAYNQADNRLLGNGEQNNILISDSVERSGGPEDIGLSNYDKKWKGPYMDGDPSDFMYDSWGVKLRYVVKGKNIYLWSAGPDMSFSPTVNDALCEDAEVTDDIIQSVGRMRRNFDLGVPPDII
ncbi:MAG: hypothetical protein Kow0029_16600 [Candidatus Rifleibacteriota bacterium]